MVATATVAILAEWILLGLGTVIVAARLYLRLFLQKRHLLVGDVLICATLIVGLLNGSFDIRFMLLGALEPQVLTDLTGFEGSEEDSRTILKLLWLTNYSWFTTCYLCKASLLAIYFQLFPKYMRRRRAALWVAAIYVVLAYIITLLLATFTCLPFDRHWSLDSQYQCSTEEWATFVRISWTLHFAGDLQVFGLPWLIVPEFQLERSLRIGLYCTFLIGLINIVFTITAFIKVQIATKNGAIPIYAIGLWTNVDVNLSIIVASLPSLRPYLRGRQALRSTVYN